MKRHSISWRLVTIWIFSAILTVGSLFVPQNSTSKDFVARGNPIELVTPHPRTQPVQFHFIGPKKSSHSPEVPYRTEGLVQHHSDIAAIVFARWQSKSVLILPDGFLFRARASIHDSELSV